MSIRTSAGFTLIEVMVSIVVGAVVVLAAVELTRAVDDSGRTAIRTARFWADASIAESRIHEWVLLAQSGRDSTDRPGGDASHFRARTRCPVAEGWRVACELELRVNGAQREILEGLTSVGDTTRIEPHDGELRLIYLTQLGGASQWADAWHGDNVLPTAVGVAGATDTLVLRTGNAP